MTDDRRPDEPRRAGRTDLAKVRTTDDRKDIPSAELDEALNPHRSEEQLRAQQHVAEVLARRGVLLAGDETGRELADLWSAVDQFESVVEARGGDTLTNATDSREPDNPAFVLPDRKLRESAADYTSRILEAAAALTNFER
jgi:hypothetical protein